MDSIGPTRFRHRPSGSAERFLGAYTHEPSHPDQPSSSSDELNEDDIFFSNDLYYNEANTASAASRDQRTAPPSSSSGIRRQKSLPTSENFGILAALRDPTRPHSHFYQKPSLSTPIASASSASPLSSSSSSSSSRMIPSIPKPPQERIPASSLSFGRHPQSAPVKVPLLAKAVRKRNNFDDDYDVEEELEGEMLPPHEIVARSSAQSPLLACSVLEGVGRTLKGRDLRQVRNAIWRQTGFLD